MREPWSSSEQSAQKSRDGRTAWAPKRNPRSLVPSAQGWRILARRVKTPRGEVDLVARRGRMVAFVEVKWRATVAERDIAIDEYRLRRVAAAAEAIAHRFVRASDDQRIDVLLLAPRHFPRHIVNAFMG